MKTKLIALGLTGLVAIGAAVPVFAQVTSGGANDGITLNANEGPGGREGHRMHAGKALIKSAAETIGIEPKELLQELKDGNKTIAQVATENGVDPQLVIDNAVAQAEARIDEAVEKGKIDEGKAAELKARVAEKIAKIVNEGRPKRPS
jgi:ribosomal protein S20